MRCNLMQFNAHALQLEQRARGTLPHRQASSGHHPSVMPPPQEPLDIEAMTKTDRHFTKEMVSINRVAHQLNTSKAEEFIGSCEFVSLGSYCGVSSALQALGLRKAAYPFDWVRSPIEGVIHLFGTDFADFLTFTHVKEQQGNQGYVSTRWGGSFWHHRPDDPQVRGDFLRRIERMLGLGDNPDVPATKPRVFIRAVNGSHEIESTVKLFESLQRAFPEGKVYLLMLIDMQETKGPCRLPSHDHDNIIFHKIHKSLWDEPRDVHKSDGPYSEAIACAIRDWSGHGSREARVCPLETLNQSCVQFDSGCPAAELMNPRVLRGQGLVLKARVPRQSARLDSQAFSSRSSRTDSRSSCSSTQAESTESRGSTSPCYDGSMSPKLPQTLTFIRSFDADGEGPICPGVASGDDDEFFESCKTSCSVYRKPFGLSCMH